MHAPSSSWHKTKEGSQFLYRRFKTSSPIYRYFSKLVCSGKLTGSGQAETSFVKALRGEFYNDFHTTILLHLNGILFWTKHQIVKPEVVGVIGHENTINIYEDKLDVNPRMLSDAGRDTAQENGGILI